MSTLTFDQWVDRMGREARSTVVQLEPKEVEAFLLVVLAEQTRLTTLLTECVGHIDFETCGDAFGERMNDATRPSRE